METLETRLRNAPIRTRTFDGTLARIAVVLLLTLLALPVFYLGIFGIYALFLLAISPHLVLIILPPVLVVLSAFGTLLSFRYVPLTVGALAAFYLGWAVSIYPFPDLWQDPFFYWARVTMIAMLCLNLAWIVWSLRGRPFWHGTLARIAVVLLLVLLALPVFYLGIFGIYALFSLAVSPHSVLLILPPVLVVLSAFGTLLSFRYVPLTAGALAAFYLGWAFSIYPFPDLLPDPFFYWARVTMIAMLCLNLAWIVWALRGRLAWRGERQGFCLRAHTE